MSENREERLLGRQPCYHVCSKGTSSDDLFKDEGDYRSAMNMIAISAYMSKADVVAFTLMSNHWHFILMGTDEQIFSFLQILNRSFASRSGHKTLSEGKVLEKMQWNRYLIETRKYFLSCLAYVLRNPLPYFQYNIFDFKWGTSSLYFREPLELERMKISMKPLGSYSVTELRKLLKTRTVLPSDWLMTPSGYIWPGNYVNIRYVEAHFGTFRAFAKFLFYSKDDDVERVIRKDSRVLMSDQELRIRIKEMCNKSFNQKFSRDITVAQRKSIAIQINSECGCGLKQLYRILNLVYHE